MSLPKLPSRICTTILPVSKKTVRFRPWQARDERLLLMAKDDSDSGEILSTVSQVVKSCVLDADFDISRAPIYDVEWLFLQTRIKSVGETVERTYIDHEDKQHYSFTIDLNKVEMLIPEAPKNNIDFGEGIAVTLKWPSAEAFSAPAILDAKEDDVAALLVPDMIDRVYDGEKVYDASTYTRDELVAFVDTFPTDAHAHAIEYLAALPVLNYKMEYTNKMGNVRRFVLSNLSDFFTFR